MTAAYIPGKDNIIADRESRNKNVDTEWMLNPRFLKLALNYFNFLPCIDIFASRINKQFNTYVSYKPDPYAKHIDAFTITWSTEDFYCFPPFSCVTKVIRKIIQDKARGILGPVVVVMTSPCMPPRKDTCKYIEADILGCEGNA